MQALSLSDTLVVFQSAFCGPSAIYFFNRKKVNKILDEINSSVGQNFVGHPRLVLIEWESNTL